MSRYPVERSAMPAAVALIAALLLNPRAARAQADPPALSRAQIHLGVTFAYTTALGVTRACPLTS